MDARRSDPPELRRGHLVALRQVRRVGAVALVSGLVLAAFSSGANAFAPWVACFGATLAVPGILLVTSPSRAARVSYSVSIATAALVSPWIFGRTATVSLVAIGILVFVAASTLWMLWRPTARAVFDSPRPALRPADAGATPAPGPSEGRLALLGWIALIGLGAAIAVLAIGALGSRR